MWASCVDVTWTLAPEVPEVTLTVVVPCAFGQLSSQHRVALLDEILPPYNRNLVPPIPIDITVGLEHRIEAMLVERHLVPRMPKELAQLTALVAAQRIGRPPLTGHQHIEKLVRQALVAHPASERETGHTVKRKIAYALTFALRLGAGGGVVGV